MNDFKRLNELTKEQKSKLNAIYKNLDDKIITEALKICDLTGTPSQKLALARRIVDLKVDPLQNELKKLNLGEDEQKRVLNLIYGYVRNLYENLHAQLIKKARDEQILDPFYQAFVEAMHELGLSLNAWQISWQDKIIDTANKEFEAKFKDLSEANEFITKNGLFQCDANGVRADRTYGAVCKEGEKFSFLPYALAFKDEVRELKKVFIKNLEILRNLAQNDEQKSYVKYLEKLQNAFCEEDNAKVINAWQEAEIAWMDVKGALQPGHPLEYYEDAYTHAVALEWDIRLVDSEGIDELKFKEKVTKTYKSVCEKIKFDNAATNKAVSENIARTQLYISVPMIYYAAELNGLFSAQVVPNDESVSAKCGKKIFAFVNHVYEGAKAKPFMKLGAEIFSKEFLDFGREILFLKPKIWKKVYEISTIGHEFGHILFIGLDTEMSMNKSGVFKFIEEYKATTGGLVNFFLHEEAEYKMAVFHELIARAVGLIAWRKVDEVRAYYCEGLIHLSLLFRAGVLKFDGKLSVDMSEQAYAKFKEICLQNYFDLAQTYAKKDDASTFLEKFCQKDEQSYLPKDEECKKFVEHFYARYEAIGNDVDDSGEWQRWQKLAQEAEKSRA